MTTKKTLKKLTLKKESIANLNNDELSQLRGGGITVSSKICIETVTYLVEGYLGVSETTSLPPYDCPKDPYESIPPLPEYNDSQWIVNDGCLLTEVVVNG